MPVSMRILIVVDSYYPFDNSCSRLVHHLAGEIHSRGHHVSILTVSPQVASGCELTTEQGVEVVRVRTGRIKHAPRPLRAVNEAMLSGTVWRRAHRYLEANRFDLIVFYAPAVFFGRLVARLKRMWGCPAYLIQRDVFPQWARDTGQLKDGVIYRYFERRAIEQYDAADVIGLETAGGVDYFRECYPGRRDRLEVLHNWTTSDVPARSNGRFRTEFGLEGKVIFFYGGNIGVAQDMDGLLRLAGRMLPRSEAAFLLVGNGSEVGRLRAEVRDFGLSNVHIHAARPEAEYLAMLAEVDVGLIALDGRLRSRNVPGKLMGYLQTGLPVLASLNPGNDLKDLLDAHGAGLASYSGEDDLLFRNAVRLLEDPELRKRMGQDGRGLLAREFSVEAAADRVLALGAEMRGAVTASPT
jgi:O26-antigen biosynthesis N-acetyl-L-fucosamine transferase